MRKSRAVVLAMAALAALSGSAWGQSGEWKTETQELVERAAALLETPNPLPAALSEEQARTEWEVALAEAETGDPDAQERFAKMHEREASKWYGRALEQYLEAAAGGDALAQYNAGLMYLKGRGTEEDDEEALEWYRKSAEQGFAPAQNSLGWMYANGLGTERDDEEAVAWYRKAAEQGHPRAQCNLGWMHEEGLGVEQSDEKALEWYRKAAEQGDEWAREKVGEMVAAKRGDAGGEPAEAPGEGRFGLDAGNPVRLVNVDLEYAYLARLEGENGNPVHALRWGSIAVPGFPGRIDLWSVEAGVNQYVDVYMHPYAESNTLAAPTGFRLDMEGIEAEFAGAPRDQAPEDTPEDAAPPRVANTPEEDAAETVRMGNIVIPPPDGYANFRSRPEWMAGAGESGPAAWLGEGENAAVFAEASAGGGWESAVAALDENEGIPTALAQFRVAADLGKGMLYRRGSPPRRGIMAPHRSNARSCQWTTTETVDGGRGVRVQSVGMFWLKGRHIRLEGKASVVSAWTFGMGAIAENRRFLEDWEDKILRANGVSTDPADFEREMEAEELEWRSAAAKDGVKAGRTIRLGF